MECRTSDYETCSKFENFHKQQLETLDENINKSRSISFKAGVAKGYYKLAVMYWRGDAVDKNYEKATDLFEYACKNNITKACTYVGVSFEDGLGIEKNKEKAMDFYSKACKENEKIGCYNLALLYHSFKNNESAATFLLDKSCSLGYGDACRFYNKMLK
jgi:TPR repeat protein